MGEKRNTPVIGSLEVADEIADRKSKVAVQVLPGDTFVDPGSCAFAVTCEKVGIEPPEHIAILAYVVVTDVLVPCGDALILLQLEAIELRRKLEQSGLDSVRWKVRA